MRVHSVGTERNIDISGIQYLHELFYSGHISSVKIINSGAYFPFACQCHKVALAFLFRQ